MIAFDPNEARTPQATLSRHGAGAALPFTAVEFAAIHLGAGDDLSSLREPGRLARLIHFWLGIRPNNPLSDHRLETLRRTTLLLRRDRELAQKDQVSFLAAGFSREQLDLLRLFTNG